MSIRRTPLTTTEPSHLLDKIAVNDMSAVGECLEKYGDWVWTVAKKHSDTPLATEQLTILIFRDIWKYAYRFKTSGLDEAVFIAMIARRRVRPQAITTVRKFGSDNRFFRRFQRYANGVSKWSAHHG